MKGQIRAHRLDSDLDLLFNDCLDYMSATESYLSNLDLIDSQNTTGTVFDVLASMWNGYKTSSDVTTAAGKLGLSDENAANAGKLVGAADAVANLYSKSQSRGATYRTALAEQARELEDRWNSTRSSLQAISRRLTQRYGWGGGEAGFDGFQSAQINDLVARSPRDPFLKARYGDSLMSDAKGPSEYIAATIAYLDAAQLVPADSSYDSLRLQYVAEATQAALGAPSSEAGTRGYSSHPSSAPVALKLARTYLGIDPLDSTGFGNMELARALAFLGRYEEAASSATKAYNMHKDYADDPSFCYRYAKLMSLTNRTQQVGAWIAQAYRVGFTAIGSIREDPDMEAFRSQQSQQFKSLTTVNVTWKLNYGFVLDDVVIMNGSPFDLTNVQLQLHLRKGTARWDPLLKCAQIRASGSCQIDNVFSIPGDSYDEGTASVTSDQN
jgi:hypothetical protein